MARLAGMSCPSICAPGRGGARRSGRPSGGSSAAPAGADGRRRGVEVGGLELDQEGDRGRAHGREGWLRTAGTSSMSTAAGGQAGPRDRAARLLAASGGCRRSSRLSGGERRL